MATDPEPIGEILAQLMARRGFAGLRSAAACQAAWRQAAGQTLARYSRVGRMRRGVLEIVVANSTLMQELGFRKAALLKNLSALLPEHKISDLRFRVGAIT